MKNRTLSFKQALNHILHVPDSNLRKNYKSGLSQWRARENGLLKR